MNETHVTIVGTVISDQRRRTVADGSELISFRVASNERRFDRTTQQWVDGDTLYANVTCWRRLVIGVGAALGKGDPVIVTGRLYTRTYEVEGQRRWSTEIDANTVGIDLSRCIARILREPKSAHSAVPVEASEAAGEATSESAAIDSVSVAVPDTAEELTTSHA